MHDMPYPFVFSGPARKAQCARTPSDPERMSPCPPHLLLLPSWLHTSTVTQKKKGTENTQSLLNRAVGELKICRYEMQQALYLYLQSSFFKV